MYAILRFQKKTGGKLLNTQKHNERQKERYKSNPDIDRERSDENIHLKAPPPSGYKRAVLERTEKAGCRLRKDSVMMIEMLITVSPELFREMSREEMMDFMKRAYASVLCPVDKGSSSVRERNSRQQDPSVKILAGWVL